MRILIKLLLLSLIFFSLDFVRVKFFNEAPPEDVVYREVFNVEAIGLEHASEKNFQGIYSLERARCTGFNKVNYQNYDHYYMGSGATLSIPEIESKPVYKVVEKVAANKSDQWPRKIILKIIDTSKGDVLGVREVWQNDIRTIGFEGASGYKGDIAARFVRKVLNPPQLQWSSTCTTKYPTTNFEVSVSEVDFTIDKTRLFSKTTNCSGISIESFQRMLDIRVNSPNWIYKTQSHPGHVYCLDNEVFIFHSIFWDELYIDWLDTSGILKGQYKVNNRNQLVTADLKYDYIDAVKLSDNILEVTQIQVNPSIKVDEKYKGMAIKSFFRININNSQGRNNWCDGKGEQYTYFGKNKECKRIAPPNPVKNLNKSKHSDSVNGTGV
ncbi:MAG: hypothetical protein HWD86_07265 [Kangiellaceae bacterium]|nr:hypothetical protein [Kangiellaceae bacterium]